MKRTIGLKTPNMTTIGQREGEELVGEVIGAKDGCGCM